MDRAEFLKDLKGYGSQFTATVSDVLKAFVPQWVKAEGTWKAWTWTKRIMGLSFIGLVLISSLFFGFSVTSLVKGSYRAADSYGRGDVLTKTDVAKQIDAKTKDLATNGDVAVLKSQIEILVKATKDLQANIDTLTAPPDASKTWFTTGSITPQVKKPKTTKKTPKAKEPGIPPALGQ